MINFNFFYQLKLIFEIINDLNMISDILNINLVNVI